MQENSGYINHISDFWNYILDNRNDLMSRTDSDTLRKLQTLMPQYSTEDRRKIEVMMREQQIFRLINDQIDRKLILSRLLTAKIRIPSLVVFRHDAILFEQLTAILKTLLPKGWGGPQRNRSVRGAFFKIFTARQKAQKRPRSNQHSENDILSKKSQFLISYRQLFLYVLRHFPRLSGEPLKKSVGDPKLERPDISKRLWHQLGELAHILGFRSETIQSLRGADIYREIAKTAVAECHLTGINGVMDDLTNNTAGSIAELLQQVEYEHQDEEDRSQPVFTSDHVELPPKMRMGKPYNSNHERDCKHLFLGQIYQDCNPPKGKYVTSLLIQRDFIFSFLGRPHNNSIVDYSDNCHVVPADRTEILIPLKRPREPSSVYSTHVSVPISISTPSRLSHQSGEDVAFEHSFVDLYTQNENELAPGIETTALSMETFRELEITESEVLQAVNTFQASRKKPVVLLDLNSNSYAKFSTSKAGQEALEAVIMNQARWSCFFTLPNGIRCVTWPRHRVLDAVTETKLVLVGDKRGIFRERHRPVIQAALVEDMALGGVRSRKRARREYYC
jgi:hypothetical protein